jgi:hypothetical protein
MGEYNSSVTRVWPIFDWLFRSDPTGTRWLTSLLRLGSRAGQVERHIFCDPGPLCPRLARFERLVPRSMSVAMGRERAARIERIRNAYEVNVPPSAALLSWLLNHPEQLTWPKATPDRECVFSPATQTNRKFLLAHEPTARTQALEELARVGASGSSRKWWAFEGFTSVDCLLETRSLLLLIEGKRTEAVSKSTDWFPGRNQVIRNLEVAQALAGGRNFAVLLCAETPFELPEEAWRNSLPHFSRAQIEELMLHYLGCATWPTIAQQLCSGLQLPEKLDDAIALCLGLRA